MFNLEWETILRGGGGKKGNIVCTFCSYSSFAFLSSCGCQL